MNYHRPQTFTVRLRMLMIQLVRIMACAGVVSTALSQEPAKDDVLTLKQAIDIALANNSSLKIASLDIDKAQWELAEFKTKRLPAFSSSVLASQLLTEISFTVKAGTFGDYPGTGPIPSQDTKITTPRRPTALVMSQVTQPLSQIYKINLGVQAGQLNTTLTGEKQRYQRQAVVKQVKQAYYAVLLAESALDAAQASVKQYEEVDRVVLQRVSQEAALRSESLDVKAKLAYERLQLIQLKDTLDSRKEALNDLLGRDIRADYRVEQVPAESFEEIELSSAQQKALASRPELREAQLNLRRADLDRRIAKADLIPDLGVAFNYLSPFNTEFVPKNIASIGLELKWEPWDWGRRKAVVNQKIAVQNQAEAQVRDTQSKILIDVNSRYRKLRESRAQIAVANAGREAARQRLVEMTHKYEEKAVLLRDVLAERAAAASADDQYEQALLAFWSARSEFEQAMGEDQ